MGRELRRKQAKKEGKSLQREIPNKEHQIKNLIIITIILVLIIGLIGLLSAILITKELDWFEKEEPVVEQKVENTILAAEVFKQKEEEYYVYFYNYDEEDEQIASVINGITDEKVYKVNTKDALNHRYVSNESNKKAKTLSDLKVKSSTVIKVSGEKITAYYENDEIKDKLKK